MKKIDSILEGNNHAELALAKPVLKLPRLERSYSPRVINRTPNSRVSQSEKLLLPDLRSSKGSSRHSRGSRNEGVKAASTRCGVVHGYGINSHTGLGHHSKLDRACIILNLQRPQSIAENLWPRSSFFALYDGHSGKSCSNFLKENLHNYILKDPEFPIKAKSVLKNAFISADREFLSRAEETGDMSGSCALVLLIIGDKCIIANTGHSRVVLSYHKGSKVKCLANVHIPEDAEEFNRITHAGGSLFRSYMLSEEGEQIVQGRAKVNPGKLPVTRALGDLDAKLEKYGGNPKVIIAEPDIRSFKISSEFDFLLVGTDSIFQSVSYKEAVEIVWNSVNEMKTEDLSVQISAALEDLVSEVNRRSIGDNVTILLIAFRNIKDSTQAENS